MKQRYWLAENGEVRCLDDQCPDECSMQCSVYVQTMAFEYMACGPVSGSVVTEMKLRDTEDNLVVFYGITEVEGIENYLKSDESLYDFQIADDSSDEEGWNKVYAADVQDHDDNDPIWRLLYYFVRAGWDAVDELKPKCIGKYLEDIEIPEYDEDDEE